MDFQTAHLNPHLQQSQNFMHTTTLLWFVCLHICSMSAPVMLPGLENILLLSNYGDKYERQFIQTGKKALPLGIVHFRVPRD